MSRQNMMISTAEILVFFLKNDTDHLKHLQQLATRIVKGYRDTSYEKKCAVKIVAPRTSKTRRWFRPYL